MCFICSGISIKKDDKLVYPIVNMLSDGQDSNKDGTGAYCFNYEDNKIYQARTLKETSLGFQNAIKDFDVVNYHFRTSTGGEKGLLNVHFWKIGKWAFAHNGTAKDFEKGKCCDSLGLFKTMLKKHLLSQEGYINTKKIKKFINSSTFWGRFILINTETRKMYYFGDWHVYLINRSYMVITSAIATFESKEMVNMLGLSFETEEETPLEVLECKLDGIFTYSKKEGFIIHDNEFKVWNYSKNWKDDNKNDEKKNEYDSIYNDTEYFGSNEYQEELKKIDDKYKKVYNSVNNNFTKENIRKLETAENEREFEIELLDEKYFGVSMRQELVLTE